MGLHDARDQTETLTRERASGQACTRVGRRAASPGAGASWRAHGAGGSCQAAAANHAAPCSPGPVPYLCQVGPAYRKLESSEAVAAAKEAAEGTLLLAYFDSDTSKEFKAFAEVAEALRNGEAACTKFPGRTPPAHLPTAKRPLQTDAEYASRLCMAAATASGPASWFALVWGPSPTFFPPFPAPTNPADVDFGYVTDHSLIEECKGADCTSPLVIMYKKGESETPR